MQSVTTQKNLLLVALLDFLIYITCREQYRICLYKEVTLR